MERGFSFVVRNRQRLSVSGLAASCLAALFSLAAVFAALLAAGFASSAARLLTILITALRFV
jgi:hypothetical protein